MKTLPDEHRDSALTRPARTSEVYHAANQGGIRSELRPLLAAESVEAELNPFEIDCFYGGDKQGLCGKHALEEILVG